MTPPAAAAAPAVRRGRAATPTRPRTAPRPRRISGPTRPSRPARTAGPATRAREREGGLALGLLAALDRVQHHRLLDRLIAGRIWIALVAFALIGIVTLQLLLLTLNGDIGRSLEREALLQRQNAALSIEDSELAAGGRVEGRATRLGMQLVAPGALKFLTVAHNGETARAAGVLSAPLQTTGSAGAEAATSTAAGGEASGEAGAEAPATPSSQQAPVGGEATSQSGEASAPGSEAPAAGAEATGAPGSEAGGAPAVTQQPAASGASAGGGTQASPGG